MKNLIIILLLFTSVSFSQEIYTFKSGGRVFENGKKINSSEIETYFGHKPEILSLYKAGRTKKTVGNILLWGGITTFVAKHLISVENSGIQSDGSIGKSKSNTLYFVAAGISLVAIPIKIGFQKKIKKSIILMNEEVKLQKQTAEINFETNIIANANGVGFKLTF